MVKKLKALVPGLVVLIPGDSAAGYILRRTKPNHYLVSWRRLEIEMPRSRFVVAHAEHIKHLGN